MSIILSPPTRPTNSVRGIRSISYDAKKINKARDEGYRDGFNVGRRKGCAEGLKKGYLRALEDVGRAPKAPRETPSSAAAKSDAGDKGGQTPVISRNGPAWKAAMAASGTKIGVAMGMYLSGDIKVNGKHAATVLRIPPCERCGMMGKSDCRVLDLAKEENLVTRMCNHCIRAAQKCAS